MKPKSIEHMQYFVGKICTIFTQPVNRNFNEQMAREHFVIRIGEISQDSVWGIRLDEKAAVWFRTDQIIGIQEEMELDPNNPEHKKMIEEFEKRSGKKMKSDISSFGVPPEPEKKKSVELPIMGQEKSPPPKQEDGDTTFVDISAIEKLAKQTKQSYNMMDMNNLKP
jgi:hypothetical protein